MSIQQNPHDFGRLRLVGRFADHLTGGAGQLGAIELEMHDERARHRRRPGKDRFRRRRGRHDRGGRLEFQIADRSPEIGLAGRDVVGLEILFLFLHPAVEPGLCPGGGTRLEELGGCQGLDQASPRRRECGGRRFRNAPLGHWLRIDRLAQGDRPCTFVEELRVDPVSFRILERGQPDIFLMKLGRELTAVRLHIPDGFQVRTGRQNDRRHKYNPCFSEFRHVPVISCQINLSAEYDYSAAISGP